MSRLAVYVSSIALLASCTVSPSRDDCASQDDCQADEVCWDDGRCIPRHALERRGWPFDAGRSETGS